ncbi:hypothetical protein E2C01_093338 [Portunus trituberculatus]|uniref:Uncharacterized protein n=1 Tax=Portunus trituberculatus TaxID=210409 RepID=A0A5B7JT49_PORTR|nr:hypothetical protein [Portunus trituberculatus]
MKERKYRSSSHRIEDRNENECETVKRSPGLRRTVEGREKREWEEEEEDDGNDDDDTHGKMTKEE